LATAIFEINDTGIQVSIDGDLVETSPAYAVLHKKELFIGREGFANARLFPGWVNTRFWEQINTEQIAGANHQIRHTADLAFSHLEKLWASVSAKADEVVFAVPGSFDTTQLGLLLGMARECGMPVTGLIDSALAAVANISTSKRALYLDIHLHYVLLTTIECNASTSTIETLKLTEQGLFTLWDRWANIIADLFVRNTRFDPMHQAETEQQLFNLLPNWMGEFEDAREKEISLDVVQSSHTVSVSAEKLLTACSSFYPQIVQQLRNQIPEDQQVELFVSHRLGSLPGLHHSLNLLKNVNIIRLDASACSHGTLSNIEFIRSDSGAVSHITSLKSTRTITNETPSDTPVTATHLLYENIAVPIGRVFKLAADLSQGPRQDVDNPICTLYTHGGDLLLDCHSPDDLRLNDQVLTGQPRLKPGDRIQLGNKTVGLISVRSGHET